MKKLLLKLLLILTVVTTAITAEDKPQAVIIFDASGSMWGQIDGVNKITIAKEALNKVVGEWNPDVELGLTVYGHRKKGDCSDIESVVPVSTVDKDKIISIIKKIQPKGKTPIARTLQQVAEELKFTEEKATIILISDGKESCDANPCDVAKNLEKRGIDFVTHVIGFNVDSKTDEQLECIADATGGEYFSAKNATALNEAMKKIVKKVEKVEPMPTPTPKPTPKKLKNNLKITASEKEGGKWIEANYNIYKQNDEGKEGKRMTNTSFTSKKEAVKNKLPVGKYIIEADYNAFNKKMPFEIKADEVTKLHIVFGQTSKVEVRASETKGGKWIKASYNIYMQNEEGKEGKRMTNTTSTSTKKEAISHKVPVGKYIIEVDYNAFNKKIPFKVKADEVTKLNIIMGSTGKVEISASEKEGGKWVRASHWIYPIVDGEKGSSIASPDSTKDKAKEVKLPIGKYIIESKYNEFTKETPFEIKVGEVTKLNIIMGQTGKVEISASEKEGGKWVRASHWIFPIVDGEKGSSIASPDSTKEKAKKIKLPIGKYIIESKYNEFTKETPFEIKSGEVTKLNIIMGQTGKVEISASEKEGGKWVRASHWIYPIIDGEKGSSIASPDSTKEKAKEVKLPIGKYIIESKYNKFTKETPFEVKAGEVTKLHINFAPFHVTIKGINQCSIVNYEVISPKGRMVTQSQAPANKGADFVLPDGTYYIESTANGVTKKNKITIGGADATKGVTVDFGREYTKSSVEGEWKTSEGTTKIRLGGTKVQGSYSQDNGELIGEMTYPQKFEGFWIEDNSDVKCSTVKNGRYYWGKVVWEFDDDMCSFKGKWGYCNKKPDSSWNGTFIKSLPKEPTKEELIKADSETSTTK